MTNNQEKNYPSVGTVDMNRGYKVSPEAGDISFIFAEDPSENWVVSYIRPYSDHIIRNKRARKLNISKNYQKK